MLKLMVSKDRLQPALDLGDDRKNYTSANGNYVVGLFGPNAEELAGRVTINAPSAQVTNGTQTGRKDQVEIGVAGVRGSIQK